VDRLRRNYEQVALGNVRKRVDFVAFSDAESATAFQEERDVRAKAGGNRKKTITAQPLFDQTEISNERSRRVARATAQAAACRNRFAQLNADTVRNPKFAPDRVHRPIHQILVGWLSRKGRIALDSQFDPRLARFFETQLILERNRLKNGAEIVKIVSPFAEDFEAQVDFGKGWDADF
jgi:hypothetical protein